MVTETDADRPSTVVFCLVVLCISFVFNMVQAIGWTRAQCEAEQLQLRIEDLKKENKHE